MPRFTIGSLLTGVTLAVLAIALWQATGGLHNRPRLVAPAGHRPGSGVDDAAAGAPIPGAIDPLYQNVLVGPEAANDYSLQDADSWDGGQDAATW